MHVCLAVRETIKKISIEPFGIHRVSLRFYKRLRASHQDKGQPNKQTAECHRPADALSERKININLSKTKYDIDSRRDDA